MKFRSTRIMSLLALVGGLAFGQDGSGTVHSDGAGLFSNLTITGQGSTPAVCSPGNCGGAWISGSGGLSWAPFEPRKPKLPYQTIAQVRASRVPVAKSSLAPAAYLKLAKDIGLESASTDEAKLAQVLADRDIKPYDFDRVDAYLYKKAEAASDKTTSYRWVWKAMRPKDQHMIVVYGDAAAGANAFYEGMGLVRSDLYKHAIPARVLETVACILDDFPEAVLLISDYEVVRPDPFLAITTPKMLSAHRIFIVDSWDEPTFNDGKEPVAVRIASR